MWSQLKVSSNRIEKMVLNKAPYIEMDNSVTHGQVAYNHTTCRVSIEVVHELEFGDIAVMQI